jgi:hypothetical protein
MGIEPTEPGSRRIPTGFEDRKPITAERVNDFETPQF